MSDHCPRCQAVMVGDAMPPAQSKPPWVSLDGQPLSHWRREVGVIVPAAYEGILFYVCPECCWAWPRFSDDDALFATSAANAMRWNSLGRPARDRETVEATVWSTWDALLDHDEWASTAPVNVQDHGDEHY